MIIKVHWCQEGGDGGRDSSGDGGGDGSGDSVGDGIRITLTPWLLSSLFYCEHKI